MRLAIAFLFLILEVGQSVGQDVVRFDDSDGVAERHARAVHAAEDAREDVWIGFSITRMMRESSVMGRFSGNWRSGPTLEELLDPDAASDQPSVEDAARMALEDIENRQSRAPERLVPKQIAIMLRRDVNGDVRDVAYSNMSMAFDPGDHAIYWIGHVGNGPAFELLEGLYRNHRTNGSDTAEDLISAIGLMDTDEVHAWLMDIIESDRPTNEREKAVFWLGESDDVRYARRLLDLADDDPSDDVREQAVFSLYRMSSGEALELLISLAQEADHMETALKARFWLAHRAGERLVAGSDASEPTELEEQTVFALSRLDDESDAVAELSRIARNHRNPHIRKQALFWLGQRGDDASLQTIMEILKGAG